MDDISPPSGSVPIKWRKFVSPNVAKEFFLHRGPRPRDQLSQRFPGKEKKKHHTISPIPSMGKYDWEKQFMSKEGFHPPLFRMDLASGSISFARRLQAVFIGNYAVCDSVNLPKNCNAITQND